MNRRTGIDGWFLLQVLLATGGILLIALGSIQLAGCSDSRIAVDSSEWATDDPRLPRLRSLEEKTGLPFPPPPKPPKRPQSQWYPFADITVARANARVIKESQRDGWSYGDQELIDQIVEENERGTKFTLYHLEDSVTLPWSFAGHGSQTNIRAFLYGVHYVYPDGSERDEFRIHGSLPLSTWQVKGPRSYMEEATNEELNL